MKVKKAMPCSVSGAMICHITGRTTRSGMHCSSEKQLVSCVISWGRAHAHGIEPVICRRVMIGR